MAQKKVVHWGTIYNDDSLALEGEGGSSPEVEILDVTASSSVLNQAFMETPAPPSSKLPGQAPKLKQLTGAEKLAMPDLEYESPVQFVTLYESWRSDAGEETDAANFRHVSPAEDKLRRIYLSGHLAFANCFVVLQHAEAHIRENFGLRVNKNGLICKIYKCPRPGCGEDFPDWLKLFLHYPPLHLNIYEGKFIHPLLCRTNGCEEAFRNPSDLLKHGQREHSGAPWIKRFYDMMEHGGLF